MSSSFSRAGSPARELWRPLQLIASKRIKPLQAYWRRIEQSIAHFGVMFQVLGQAAVAVVENARSDGGVSLAGCFGSVGFLLKKEARADEEPNDRDSDQRTTGFVHFTGL